MNNDFELGGRQFKLNKINALKQYHIVRRIGPIMGELLPALNKISKIQDTKKLNADQEFDQIATFASPIMHGISKLSDADSEFVLFSLLASVEMKQTSGNWAKVANDNMLMMQDMELPTLLKIAGRAFAFNLSGFLAVPPAQK